MKILRLCLALTIVFPSYARLEVMAGKVISVQAGDQLTVRTGKRVVRIYLAGIEAPQKRQIGYQDSRANLAGFCLNRRALVSVDLSGPGIRTGTVDCKWRGGYADMILYQLDQGWAWLQPWSTDPEMVQAQNRAQSQCVGIWRQILPHCATASTRTISIPTSLGTNSTSSSGVGSGTSYNNGPKGGCYTYTASGNKRYVDHSYCGR